MPARPAKREIVMTLSLDWNGPQSLRTAADLSPNNRGFAMAVWHAGLDDRVTGSSLGRGKPPIDNNPTPSYLSLERGRLPVSRRISPKSAAFPERRMQNPGATTW